MLIKVTTLGLISVIIAACAAQPIHCPVPKINNHTKAWHLNDEQVLQKAQKRCKEIWADAPCLKRFDKLDELRYTAACGSKD